MKKENAKRDRTEKILHDIKSPLNVIKNYFEFVPALGDSDQQEFHTAAASSLEKLCEFISELADPAKANEFDPKTVDLAGLITEVVKKLGPQAKMAGISIKYSGPSYAIGKFDAYLIDRLITNLVKNAVEAFDGKNGTVEISLHCENDTFWLDVRDSAKGMPEEIREKIFEKHFTFGKQNGTGIGLDICKDIAELHNGNIRVHSLVGSGTVFTVNFPGSARMVGEKRADVLQLYINGDMQDDTATQLMSKLQNEHTSHNIHDTYYSIHCVDENSL